MEQVESRYTAVPSPMKISRIPWTPKGSVLTYLRFRRLFLNNRDRLLCMANRGENTNSSQFFITLRACPHLDGNLSPLVVTKRALDSHTHTYTQASTSSSAESSGAS